MLVSPLELFEKAKKAGYAIGAFNTSDLNITKAIIAASQELRSPVIIETSESEIGYLGPKISGAEVLALAEKATIPIALHLDHGKNFETVVAAVKNGYTSVHIDGSANEYKINVELTKNTVKFAHKEGVAVEGEIGHITGSSEAHEGTIQISPDTLSDPEEAKKFVEETGVDVLAVAIGNIHGIYKNPPKLDINRLKQISAKVPIFFSLHGGSGIPKNQIREAIKAGVVKINVNTEIRMAFKAGLIHEFEVNPDEVIPYKYLPAGTEAVKKVVEKKIRLFGSENRA